MRLFFRTAFLLCTMLLFTAQAFAAELRSYAVMPFQINGPSGYAYLEKAIPSMLTSRLAWQDHLQPVDDSLLARAGQVKDPGSASRALAALNADYIVWGNVTIIDQDASVDVQLLGKDGKTWNKSSRTQVSNLIAVLQGAAASLNAEVFGRGGQKSAVRGGNGNFTNDSEPTQRQTYLNPQFRYQGNDGTRLRSQPLNYATVGMAVGDVNGDGKSNVVLLGEKKLYVLAWDDDKLKPLGEYTFSRSLDPLLVRTLDVNRDNVDEIILVLFNDDLKEPASYILGFKGNNFTEVLGKTPYFLNVVRTAPDFIPTLIGQKGDSYHIFSRGGVYEMVLRGDTVAQNKKLTLPKGTNALNFAYLPGKPGVEPDKILVLSGEEKLRVYSSTGKDQLYESNEAFSGAGIGIFEPRNLPGLAKDTKYIIENQYYIPMRMVINDFERDGTWEVLLNHPVSVMAQYFQSYRSFPEGEIQNLFWDGVGMSLHWKTRRIKGTVVDYSLGDLDNNGQEDLIVCVNTHPGALGFNKRKTYVIAYPLDKSLMDPTTAPSLVE